MAKMSNAAMVQALGLRGIEVEESNPNLATICKGLGLISTPAHSVKVLAYSSKLKSEVPIGTEGAATYVAVSGGARGRDAWFPVKGSAAATLASIGEAVSEALADLTPAS